MFRLSNVSTMELFRFVIAIALIISFYMLFMNVYYKEYREINCWRFPMLLAMLLETYILI
jgi:hypothetical protein